ncbi:nucleotide exchange factor GrpE [Lyngbya confervoides]|uniref:Protein GrpE n=1 Tax=Lyngbya confervoides BDU141951 TaxID=1574623 RepID=A0ABD4T4L3_9CYAN|nr:nucleotide exchange factor GrpE [Lyngbya confervoides]MCM1983467.1 nucleotide exchange factor GrpE [Lyngbya confervoides BDU141951]
MNEESTPIDNLATETELSAEETMHSPADMEHPVAPEASQGEEPAMTVDPVDTPPSPEPPSALSEELTSVKLQLEDRTGQYMRLAADFDNYRKRTTKEKAEFEARAKCNTIIELLPVIDNFERARSQIKPQTEGESNIHKSYQGIYKQLVDCLKKLGVSPMRAEGELFDPNLHEAVMREPTSEYPEDTVIEELRRGYILGDQVIRHAMVRVAAPTETDSHEADSAEVSESSQEAQA